MTTLYTTASMTLKLSFYLVFKDLRMPWLRDWIDEVTIMGKWYKYYFLLEAQLKDKQNSCPQNIYRNNWKKLSLVIHALL